MKNVDFSVENDVLIIKINLLQELGLSGSGKSITVATSEGNQSIGVADIKMGLNVYKTVK